VIQAGMPWKLLAGIFTSAALTRPPILLDKARRQVEAEDHSVEFVQDEVSHRNYLAPEVTALLKECGLRSIDVYGDLEGAPYDDAAQRLIVVAQK
jgi:hypothetical protein